MHRDLTAVARVVAELDVQRLVVAGDGDQLPGAVPGEMVAVLVAVIDARDAPFADAGRIWPIQLVLALGGLQQLTPCSEQGNIQSTLGMPVAKV
ncbi:hypothetical protein [Serratia rubidaea]|uniref:Uncharacterized protein n=1 Tax=Serratia rubidaea TaxID=61652 RepID=A0A448SLW7_SERRU|nr:hypothetical protein [Serratia rubidaea]MDC6118512.1 hypothetical protein [Serratia rubidaea]VEI68657.1 Uncharacterised protein [Serratia rubidaea]